MNRSAQAIVIVLLAMVVALGGMLVARGRQELGQDASGGLVVYAPCGMSSPLTIATQQFRTANPDVTLNVVFDNAIVLVRKIRAGDRPDVFISPGEVEMKQLLDEGFIDPDTVVDFGTLDMVVIAPAKTKDLASAAGLRAPNIKLVSLADPKYNSVGWYGAEALRSMGLWDDLQHKLLLREYPLEAVTLATDGRVDAGITYLTCPLETAPEKADATGVRIVEIIPREAYPPIRLQLGILKESRRREQAQRYIEFMTSAEGQQAVSTSGVLPADEIGKGQTASLPFEEVR